MPNGLGRETKGCKKGLRSGSTITAKNYIARVYIGLGDKDRALQWLRKGYDEYSDQMLRLAVEPSYDGWRSDPRFIRMLQGIGLAP